MSGRAFLLAVACLAFALESDGWGRIALFVGAACWYVLGLIELAEWARDRRKR